VSGSAQAARLASELRLVLGQLVRRLRVDNTYPVAQMAVLSRLDRGGPTTASTLAGEQHVRPQSMAETLAEMDRLGLVERTPDASDRRRVVVTMTDAGRTHLNADRRRREGWLAEAIATELSDDERRTLREAVALLQRVANR
jgi:DNA-binding MarR family transcriptional regulator